MSSSFQNAWAHPRNLAHLCSVPVANRDNCSWKDCNVGAAMGHRTWPWTSDAQSSYCCGNVKFFFSKAEITGQHLSWREQLCAIRVTKSSDFLSSIPTERIQLTRWIVLTNKLAKRCQLILKLFVYKELLQILRDPFIFGQITYSNAASVRELDFLSAAVSA